MTIDKNFSDNWLLVKNGESSLRLRSFKLSANDPELLILGENLLNDLINYKKEEEYVKALKREEIWHISLVYISTGTTVLKSDIVRSAPLFYSDVNDHLSVKDRLPFNDEYEIDQDSVFELVDGNYVLGNRTVYKNIFGIEAAEIIFFKDGEVRKNRYFTYDVDWPAEITDMSNLKEDAAVFDKILLKIFKEVIQSIPEIGRIIVPLSGGHDSRIVVNYLYKLGFRNVICYTYGMPGNVQSNVSKKVANALGYDWYFLEYTNEKWYELHKSGEFDRFIEYACNGVSNPHLQDFLAVSELKRKGILKSNDVFIPGHGLDMLTHNIDYSRYDGGLVENAIRRFNRRRRYKAEKETEQYKRTLQLFKESGVAEEAFLDYLLWHERQAKFTINSFRVYEFFGYEARAPFWDSELVLFLLTVTKQLKYHRDFMREAEIEKLLVNKLKTIPFSKERVINSKKKKKKKRNKSYLPLFLKIFLLKITGKKPYQDEGLNLIYTLKAGSVKKLIAPMDHWPEPAIRLIKKHFYRHPYQLNHHYLTRLYTVKKIYAYQSKK